MGRYKTILSIDSSLACPAFATLCFDLEERKVMVTRLTHIKTSAKKPTGHRLSQINDLLSEHLMGAKFDGVVMEKGFNRFAVATQQIQRTNGVIMLNLWEANGHEVAEIAPTTVKKALTGSGKASKEEVAEALVSYVGDVKFANNDESDACGVGVAYGIQKGWL